MYAYLYINIHILIDVRSTEELELQASNIHRVAKTHRIPYIADHFRQKSHYIMSLLRKMTYKDKGSYESSPPCTCIQVCMHIHIQTYIHIFFDSRLIEELELEASACVSAHLRAWYCTIIFQRKCAASRVGVLSAHLEACRVRRLCRVWKRTVLKSKRLTRLRLELLETRVSLSLSFSLSNIQTYTQTRIYPYTRTAAKCNAVHPCPFDASTSFTCPSTINLSTS